MSAKRAKPQAVEKAPTTPTIVTDAVFGKDAVEVCNLRLYRPSIGHNMAYDKLRKMIPEASQSSGIDLALAVQVYSTHPSELRKFVQEWTFEKLEDVSCSIRIENIAEITHVIGTLLKNVKKLQQVAEGEEGGGNPTKGTVG